MDGLYKLHVCPLAWCPVIGKVGEIELEKCKASRACRPGPGFCSTWTSLVCKEPLCKMCLCGGSEAGEEFLRSGCYCSVLFGVHAILSPGSRKNDSFGALPTKAKPGGKNANICLLKIHQPIY